MVDLVSDFQKAKGFLASFLPDQATTQKLGIYAELTAAYPDFGKFAKLLQSDNPDAKTIGTKLGEVFKPAPGAAPAADPQLAMLQKLKEAAAKNPDFFKQVNTVLFDDKGEIRPGAVEAVTAAADNPALRQQLTDSLAKPAGEGPNMLAALGTAVSANPSALQFIAKSPDVVAEIMKFTDPAPAQIMKDLGDISAKLQDSPLMAALSHDAGGGDMQQKMAKSLVALVKEDKTALTKLNQILGLPGSKEFLQLVASDEGLRAGFSNSLMGAEGDPKAAADALDKVYDATRKNKKVLQETVEFSQKHPQIFKIATGFMGSNPGGALDAMNMMGGFSSFMDKIPAGLKEILGKLLEMIAPGLNKLGGAIGMSDTMGDDFKNWIAPKDGAAPVTVSNANGDLTKQAGVVTDVVYNLDGQPVVPETEQEREVKRGVPVPGRAVG
jgi:hypothetical protein